MRGAGAMPVGPVALIEREPEPFALLHDNGVLVTILGIAPRNGPSLRHCIAQQQMVGNVLMTGGRLLRHVVIPAE